MNPRLPPLPFSYPILPAFLEPLVVVAPPFNFSTPTLRSVLAILTPSVPALPVHAYADDSRCGCLLCKRGSPPCVNGSKPTWPAIVLVALFILHTLYPSRPYFSLKRLVYPFMLSHWELLGLHKKNNNRWKKQVVDALCKNGTWFSSGQVNFEKNGYWGLKLLRSPWLMPGKLVSSRNRIGKRERALRTADVEQYQSADGYSANSSARTTVQTLFPLSADSI